MTRNPETRSCAEFQARLADLIGSGADLTAEPHLHSCELCHALLADLEAIATAARTLFPGVEPPEEVWDNIESAIQKKAGGGDGEA